MPIWQSHSGGRYRPRKLHVCTNSPVAERAEADLMRHTTCQGRTLGSPQHHRKPQLKGEPQSQEAVPFPPDLATM